MKKSFIWTLAAALTCSMAFTSCAKQDYPTPWNDPDSDWDVYPDWEIDFYAMSTKYVDKTGVTISDEVTSGVGTVSVVNGKLQTPLEDGTETFSEELDSRFALQTGTTWLIRPGNFNGLYQANGGNRKFGVLKCKKDQEIAITVTAQPTILSGDATLLDIDNGVYKYAVNESGDIIFNLARYNTIKKIVVRTFAGANYTVKYVNENGEKVKEDAVYKGEIGSQIKLTAVDKDPIYLDADGNVVPFGMNYRAEWAATKLVYDTDDADNKVVTSEGTSVVTVKFKNSETWNYRLNLVDATNTTSRFERIDGTMYSVDDAFIGYKIAYQKDGKWYITPRVGSYKGRYFTFSEKTAVMLPNGSKRAEQNIEYTLNEDIAFIADFEDKDALTLVGECKTWIGWVDKQFWAWGNYNIANHFDRFSNGKAARLTEGSYFATPALAAGTYKMFIYGRNGSDSVVQTVALYVMDANGEMTAVDLSKTTIEADAEGKYNMPTIGTAAMALFQIGGIVIPEGGKLVIKNDGQASFLDLDFIALSLNPEADLDALTN